MLALLLHGQIAFYFSSGHLLGAGGTPVLLHEEDFGKAADREDERGVGSADQPRLLLQQRVEPKTLFGPLFVLIDDVPLIDPIDELDRALRRNRRVEQQMGLGHRQPVQGVMGLRALRRRQQETIVPLQLAQQPAPVGGRIIDAAGRDRVG